jgi:hypothetical protein
MGTWPRPTVLQAHTAASTGSSLKKLLAVGLWWAATVVAQVSFSLSLFSVLFSVFYFLHFVLI